MGYIIQTLIQLLLDGATMVFDMLGQGVLILLKPNFGAEDNVFGILLNGFGPFTSIIGVFALFLLGANFVWQLVKMMTSPQGTGETPAALLGKTFLCGLTIYAAPTIIQLIQNALFLKLYDALLETSTASEYINGGIMSQLTQSLGDVVSNGWGFVTTIPSALAELILMVLFLVVIMFPFASFLIEIVERYMVLGVLYYTAPLPIAFGGSKATSNIFSSWVKMLLSQLFLMSMNVLFFKLFLISLHNFNTTVLAMSEIAGKEQGVSLTYSLLWCFLTASLLYVGTKIDAYMATLGLSTAQCGRGLGAAVMSAVYGAERVAKTAGSVVGGVRNKLQGKRAKDGEGGAKPQQNKAYDKKSGGLTADSVRAGLKGELGTPVSKKEATQAVKDRVPGIKGLDEHATNPNGNAGQFGNCMTAATLADAATGNRMNLALLDSDKVRESGKDIMGVDAGDGTFVAMDKNAASSTAIPRMEQMIADAQSRDKNGYETKAVDLVDSDGRVVGAQLTTTDSTGNIMSQKQILPMSMFNPETSLPVTEKEIDGQKFAVVDTTAMATEAAGYGGPGTMEKMIPFGDNVQQMDSDQALKENFNNQGFDAAKNVAAVNDEQGKQTGAFTYQDASGQTHVIAPISQFQPTASYADKIDTKRATNGAVYMDATLAEGDSAGAAVQMRETSGSTPIYGSTKEQAPIENWKNSGPTSEIMQGAMAATVGGAVASASNVAPAQATQPNAEGSVSAGSPTASVPAGQAMPVQASTPAQVAAFNAEIEKQMGGVNAGASMQTAEAKPFINRLAGDAQVADTYFGDMSTVSRFSVADGAVSGALLVNNKNGTQQIFAEASVLESIKAQNQDLTAPITYIQSGSDGARMGTLDIPSGTPTYHIHVDPKHLAGRDSIQAEANKRKNN